MAIQVLLPIDPVTMIVLIMSYPMDRPMNKKGPNIDVSAEVVSRADCETRSNMQRDEVVGNARFVIHVSCTPWGREYSYPALK